MNPTRAVTRILVPLAVTALALTACSSGTTSETASVASSAEEVMESESAMESDVMESEVMESESAMDDAAMAAHGSYITLADFQGNPDMYAKDKVVLFFHADWCPTCKATEENLNADPTGIPAGLTIVKIDYDNSDDLKQKYGITTQHTFVQVDADGNELGKWTGSATAEDIAGQTA